MVLMPSNACVGVFLFHAYLDASRMCQCSC